MSLVLAFALVLAAETESVDGLMRGAAAARYEAREPQKAIELFRRAAAVLAQKHPETGRIAFLQEIADIQQFDLGDRKAAAATSLLTFVAVFDRSPEALAKAEVVTPLVRTKAGEPTRFALLSREYAKSHPIPKVEMQFGH